MRKRSIDHYEMGNVSHFYEMGSFEVDGIIYTPPGFPLTMPMENLMFSLKTDNLVFEGEVVTRPRHVFNDRGERVDTVHRNRP